MPCYLCIILIFFSTVNIFQCKYILGCSEPSIFKNVFVLRWIKYFFFLTNVFIKVILSSLHTNWIDEVFKLYFTKYSASFYCASFTFQPSISMLCCCKTHVLLCFCKVFIIILSKRQTGVDLFVLADKWKSYVSSYPSECGGFFWIKQSKRVGSDFFRRWWSSLINR